jgi:hypothetical protein
MKVKEYIKGQVNLLTTKPGSVLRGHTIPKILVDEIKGRPDLAAKLATIAYSTVGGNLQKEPGFAIYAFPNFGSFHTAMNGDKFDPTSIIEEFMAGLDPADQRRFNINKNIAVVICVPEKVKKGTTDEEQIVVGQSLIRGMKDAVSSQSRSLRNASYYAVFIAPSNVAPPPAKPRTRLDIKAELLKKQQEALEHSNLEIQGLRNKYSRASQQLNAYKDIYNTFGYDQYIDDMGTPNPKSLKSHIRQLSGFSNQALSELNAALAAASEGDRKVASIYMNRIKKGGKPKDFKYLLKDIESEELKNILVWGWKGIAEDGISIVKKKRADLTNNINELNMQILNMTDYLKDAANAGDVSSMRRIKYSIETGKRKLDKMNMQLAAYMDLSTKAINNKKKIAEGILKDIAKEVNRGTNLKEAIVTTMQKIKQLSPSQKIAITTDVVSSIAEGDSPAMAVQQAVAQNLQAPVQTPIQQAPIQQIIPEEVAPRVRKPRVRKEKPMPTATSVDELLRFGL